MSQRKLRVGIIGCGEIAVATAKGIAEAENARIVRVMDVREELATRARAWDHSPDDQRVNTRMEPTRR